MFSSFNKNSYLNTNSLENPKNSFVTPSIPFVTPSNPFVNNSNQFGANQFGANQFVANNNQFAANNNQFVNPFVTNNNQFAANNNSFGTNNNSFATNNNSFATNNNSFVANKNNTEYKNPFEINSNKVYQFGNQLINSQTSTTLSFNDIIITPVYTNIKLEEKNISLYTKLTKNTPLHLPIISFSNNVENIIKLNLLGGLGVFKSDDLEKQIQFIKSFKNYLKFIDETPVSIYSNATYQDIYNLFLQYSLEYIVVIDENNTFIGFILKSYFDLVSILDTNICANQIMIPLSNLKYYKTYDYNWSNLLIENPHSDIINDLNNHPYIPIICDNNKLYGVITLKNTILFYTYKTVLDNKGKLVTAISTSIFSDCIDRITTLVNLGLDIIFIKIDNADNIMLINTIKDIKNKFPQLQIIVGNVYSTNSFISLCEAGVDSILVGNGTELGQFTLLKECSKLSKMYNVSIINNSGIPSTNTNIFKAFAAGSHSLLIENDSTFNYEISDILKLIKHGLMSLNVLNIQQLHSSNIEYTKS